MDATMRALFGRLRFTVEAQRVIVAEQMIDTLGELTLLNDDKCSNLCKVVQQPGGDMANPNAENAGAPPRILNPGTSVSMVAQSNLKLATYWLQHRQSISQVTQPGDLLLLTVRAIKELKQEEEQHQDPDTKPTINAKNWPKTLESINDYIDGYLGVTGAPLSYVIRMEPAIQPGADDPEANYDTEHEQMVARMPHTDGENPAAWYVTDNRKTYDLIHTLFHDTEHWIYIKPFQRTKDGGGAYQAIWNHYLGPNNIDHMATEAEKSLDTSREAIQYTPLTSSAFCT
jgi:hypothetical protein